MSVLQVTSDQDFASIINNNPNVLMEFYASWCPHCQAFFPVLEQTSTQLNEEGIVVAQTEIDTFPQLANDFNVESIPTLVYFKDSQATLESAGTRDEQGILSFVKQGQSQQI